MSPVRMAGLDATYCQCSLEVAPRCTMSALERLPQTSVRSSYCDSRAVIGDATAGVALGAGCRRKSIFVCRIVVVVGIGIMRLV
jgi:hypothetical protein